jgi:hypothetical protein
VERGGGGARLGRIERHKEWGIEEEWGERFGREGERMLGLVGNLCGGFLLNMHREGYSGPEGVSLKDTSRHPARCCGNDR